MQQRAETIVALLRQVDLAEEVGPVVGGDLPDRRGEVQLFVTHDECLDLFDVLAILRDVGQCFGYCMARMRPGACMGPVDGPNVAVGLAIRSVLGLGRDLATSDDLAPTPLGIDDVTHGHLILELPATEHSIVPGNTAPISLQRLPEGFAIGIGSEIAEAVPMDRHNPAREKLIPFRGLGAGREDPVVALAWFFGLCGLNRLRDGVLRIDIPELPHTGCPKVELAVDLCLQVGPDCEQVAVDRHRAVPRRSADAGR